MIYQRSSCIFRYDNIFITQVSTFLLLNLQSQDSFRQSQKTSPLMFSEQGVKKVGLVTFNLKDSFQLVDETINNALKRASLTDDDLINGGSERVSADILKLERRDSLDDMIDHELAGGEDSYDYEDSEEVRNHIHSIKRFQFTEDSVLGEDELARAHWMQLQKTNKQGIVIQNAFIHILSTYKHMRPVWQFGRKIDDTKDDWKSRLYEDFYFRCFFCFK